MKRFLMVLAVLLITTPALSPAAQFSIVGPRALGMGGAGVAAVNDSTAVYWNPAALARYRRVDIRIPASAALRDHMDLKNTWDEIDTIDELAKAGDPASLDRLAMLIRRLGQPDTGVDVDGSAGLLISIPLPNTAMAISGLGLGYAALYPTADLYNLNSSPSLPLPPDSVTKNYAAVTGIGIGTVQPALSFAARMGNMVYIGMNAKMIYAQTFVNSDYILDPVPGDSGWDNFSDNLDRSKLRSDAASVDAGVIIAPAENFSIGIVGRDINAPEFPVRGTFAYQTGVQFPAVDFFTYQERKIELKPQVRAGLAWKPYETLTLAVDYDLTRNKTLVPGFEDQTVAVGLEQTVWSEYLSFRVGAYKNVAAGGSNAVYTAGLGTRIWAFRLDFAGAYDFDEKEYQASLNLALKF